MGNGTVVSIGTFDGVHKGHQAILTEVGRQAKARQLKSVAYAFEIPPRWTAEREPFRFLLLPRPLKTRFLKEYVDRVLSVSLSQVRDLSPETFANHILGNELNAAVVVVGTGFRFGRHREGDVERLREIGQRLGISVVSVLPIEEEGIPVSSTWIRRALRGGYIDQATRLLGRPPILLGEVSPGDHVGRTLGYPTANLVVEEQILLPAVGIYLTHVFYLGRQSEGLLYVGSRPTLGGGELRCEIHLLTNPDQDLYGELMEIQLLERLREDRTFPSLTGLRRQIERDIAEAKKRLPRYAACARSFSG